MKKIVLCQTAGVASQGGSVNSLRLRRFMESMVIYSRLSNARKVQAASTQSVRGCLRKLVG